MSRVANMNAKKMKKVMSDHSIQEIRDSEQFSDVPVASVERLELPEKSKGKQPYVNNGRRYVPVG